MADDRDTIDQAHRFLGHIDPAPGATKDAGNAGAPADDLDENPSADDAEKRAGSRDVDEGGGVASEVGGTRNYHHSGGATGGDLGNRPE
jgi:hypothetical protein